MNHKYHHIISRDIKLVQESLLLIAHFTLYWWQLFTVNPLQFLSTYRWARPALRTAEEMALMAVSMAVMSWVSSPVAPLAWRPVSMINRVRVHTSVSNADWSDMLGSGFSVSLAEQLVACPDTQQVSDLITSQVLFIPRAMKGSQEIYLWVQPSGRVSGCVGVCVAEGVSGISCWDTGTV